MAYQRFLIFDFFLQVFQEICNPLPLAIAAPSLPRGLGFIFVVTQRGGFVGNPSIERVSQESRNFTSVTNQLITLRERERKRKHSGSRGSI